MTINGLQGRTEMIPIRYGQRMLVLAGVAISLGGCGATLEKLEDGNSFLVAAAPLCEDISGQTFGDDATCKAQSALPPLTRDDNQKYPNKTRIGWIINESEYKCGKFLNGLVLASNGSSVTLDGMTTLFSALGTVFTPLNLVHALTAGSTITSGWSGVIRSDIYAQRTVENYAQAIQSSYYDAIQNYLDDLGKVTDDTTIIIPNEVARIRIIHKSCALAAAQATISATLKANGASPTSADTTTTTIDVLTGQAANSVFTVTGTGGLNAKYSESGTEQPTIIASKLVDVILAPANKFVAAGVTAAPVTGKASFTVTAPATVQISVSGNLKIEAATSAGVAAPSRGAAGSTGASSVATTNVSGKVSNPGAPINSSP